MKRMFLSILVIGILLLSACSAATTAPSTEAPPASTLTPKPLEVDFFLTLKTELIGNELTISGETNLPDGSRLGVSTYRLYKCEGDPEWYVGDLAPDSTATVENGKYSDVCMIDESWYDLLSRIFRNTGNPPIVEVSDELSVGVIFTPKRQQPASVYEILGPNADNLKGERVEPVKGFGETFYVLEANAEVYFPFALAPTPEEPAVEEPSIITSKADLQKFLEENYATLNTSLGPTDFTFIILENTYISRPYDYWIIVDYDFSFFTDLKYSNKISTEMNHKVADELRAHQESLAKAVIQKMPDTKFCGGYHYSWYTYPNIKVDLNVRRYYSWVNYNPASILTSYDEAYDEAKISEFTWYSELDDELVR